MVARKTRSSESGLSPCLGGNLKGVCNLFEAQGGMAQCRPLDGTMNGGPICDRLRILSMLDKHGRTGTMGK